MRANSLPGWFRTKGSAATFGSPSSRPTPERIGHGVDVMYEDRPVELLKEMAAKHILVEISLTSNDVILGVSGKDHPLPRTGNSAFP